MTKLYVLGPIVCICILSGASHADKADATKPTLTGTWILTGELFGTPQYFPMELTQEGNKVTGKFEDDTLEGTFDGVTFQFHGKDTVGGYEDAKATLANGLLTGTIVLYFSNDPKTPVNETFTATMIPKRGNRPPRRHDFTPTVFYRQFSAANKPVLSVAPGDTIHTTTVDAGGVDAKGVRRVLGGNPQTGPFYVEGALPGDLLVVHVVKLRLNRDYAVSDDGIVGRGMNGDLAVKMKDGGGSVRWHLDAAKGVATSEKPGDHLARYTVPLRPMLGCVATAPNPAQASPGTGDSGPYGGNMDFNEIVDGSTVYLPVRNPGALLYFGDGHAAQGDGELTGDALETSLDVEVSVDLISRKNIRGVRVESPTHIMAMGLDGSLDGAFREATANMASWLNEDYKLTPSEVAQVLGTSAEYRVSEVADRNAGIVLKISKERLRGLTPAAK
jgi:acetamidase/formamidase